MDFEKEKRRQTLKVIIAESLMVLSVVALVMVLISVVSGYWINADFEVERSGLLQISSFPTGATIAVDDTTWFQRTNTSKMVTSAKHTVVVTKDGYDTWAKDIVVPEGLLYRLHYPRLFLKERHKEEAMIFKGVTQVKVSPKRDIMLVNQAAGWSKINLNSDMLVMKALTNDEAASLIKDWEKLISETENYDEEGNILLRFYEDQYSVKIEEDFVTVTKKDSEEVVLAEQLPFVPKASKVGHAGEFVVMSSGNHLATLDMETMAIVDWKIESERFGWLDTDMIYTVDADGKLIVYDYDGLNRREITENVAAEWPATITNNKWLYYFSQGNLMREWLIPHTHSV